MLKAFIVGSSGTTGLRIHSRLAARSDVELLEIDEALHRDASEIKRLISAADFVFLCLPDTAAIEAVALAEGSHAKIIDCSTAHRSSGLWAYGFPELSAQHRSNIISASRLSVPGCHASGLISLLYPLVSAALLSENAALSATSITGYSGGGKKMIADYEDKSRPPELNTPFLYAMGQEHKHLPEVMRQCSLKTAPIFMPIVGDFYSGMLVTVPLNASMLRERLSVSELREVYKAHYGNGGLVRVSNENSASLHAGSMTGRDDMEIFISGNDERILLSARFDNLGKGASGAALQCFNLMCGLPEDRGLVVG
ncbi:MAG: N-acetyl-gamma-glutamyl-phosphate reductase [Oscillospiraceae bacterium]